MKSYIILIMAVISNFSSQLFFEELSKEVSFDFFSIENIEQLILNLFYKLQFWVALSLFGLGALLWIIGLKKIALTKAFSIASLNYILIFAYSFFVLNSAGSILKIASCFFIVLGIIILANNETLILKWENKNN